MISMKKERYGMIRGLVINYRVTNRTETEAILKNKVTGDEIRVLAEGRVFRGDKELTGRCHNKDRVAIPIDTKEGRRMVYRYALVMYAFGLYTTCNEFDLIVNHKDNIHSHDNIDNLEVCTRSENCKHGAVHKYLINNGLIELGYVLTVKEALEVAPLIEDAKINSNNPEKLYKKIVATYKLYERYKKVA